MENFDCRSILVDSGSIVQCSAQCTCIHCQRFSIRGSNEAQCWQAAHAKKTKCENCAPAHHYCSAHFLHKCSTSPLWAYWSTSCMLLNNPHPHCSTLQVSKTQSTLWHRLADFLHILVNIIHWLRTKQNCLPIKEHRYLNDYRVFLRILMSILESLPSLSWPLLTISASLSNSVQPLMEALAHLPCVPAVCWHKLLSRPILAICLHQCIYLRPISASLDL